MKIPFQAYADLNEIIVGILLRRAPEIDFQTATLASLEGLPDPQVLAIAAREGRILVSHDHATMAYHFFEFATMHVSPGVFIIPQHLPLRRTTTMTATTKIDNSPSHCAPLHDHTAHIPTD